MPVTGQSV